MLISLVHAGGDHEAANDIFARKEFDASDETLRRNLEWVRAVVTPNSDQIPNTSFTEEQMPEVIATLMGMSDINRFSHVVMEDSPVAVPFGMRSIKSWMLRIFGSELKVTRQVPLVPGRSLGLLPPGELPDDMQWAKPNPRVADAVSRWAAAVEREGAKVVSSTARKTITDSLNRWNGEKMPLDTNWIACDVAGLNGEDKAIARLSIVLAKASYRVTEKMVSDVLGEHQSEERFIRILAWSSFAAARRFAQIIAQKIADKNSLKSLSIAA